MVFFAILSVIVMFLTLLFPEEAMADPKSRFELYQQEHPIERRKYQPPTPKTEESISIDEYHKKLEEKRLNKQ